MYWEESMLIMHLYSCIMQATYIFASYLSTSQVLGGFVKVIQVIWYLAEANNNVNVSHFMFDIIALL